MLSISQPMKGCGRGEYYLHLAREDYYLEGGEPPGEWYGEGAEQLGLSGEIEQEHFRNLLRGYTPDGSEELTQNAGDEERRSGWDLTFSAPKSVSALWALADDDTRRDIQALQKEAVRTALDYLEQNAGWTRRGKDGAERERSALIFTTFEHGTSRAQEPDLHTHVIVQNLSLREDGTSGTIDSAPLYQHKMAAGALYRAELSRSLEQELGLEIRRDRDSFRIDGVSKELCDRWSTRRKEIVEALHERGLSGAKAAAVAAFDTREAKAHVPRVELFQTWAEQGRELSFGRDQALELLGEGLERSVKERALAKRQILDRAIAQCTKNQSYFTERELVRFAAVEAQGLGLSAGDVLKAVKDELGHSREIVHLGVSKHEERFTTREMLELERNMLEHVRYSRSLDFSVSAETVRRVSKAWERRDEELSQEQKAALKHITLEKGGISAVSGMAGAGKSRMLSAAREVWEREGLTVIGAALAGKAAQGLEQEAGIKSDTIHKTLSEIEHGRRSFGRNTVLVIDEAGMVGTRQMSELVRVAKEAEAKLVLVGDERQLQPIDAGGPFRAIQEEIGVSRLTKIRRQREVWARDAVKDFAFGNARKGLEVYAEKGLLSIEDDRKLAQEKLLSDWSVQGIREPEKNLILAGSNAEVRELNQGAQEKRLQVGALGERALRRGEERFYVGDRIVFGRNSRLYGVRNGELGTVREIDRGGRLSAELEDGRRVSFSLEQYEHVRLGYAVTTHKAQGITVERAYVLAGGEMQDRELTYVQMSRARENTRIYIDREQAGENLRELTLAMERSRAKELAVRLKRQQHREHDRSRRVEDERELGHGIGR